MSEQDRARRTEIGFHVTMRLGDDRPIAVSQNALRILARVMLEQGASRRLLAFEAADNHLHAALACPRFEAGAFCRYVQPALVWQLKLGARFERAHIRPLQDQRHVRNSLLYILRQSERHALSFDPLREGSSIADVLGLRVLPTSSALIAQVRSSLPRLRRADIIACFPAVAPALDPSQTPDLELLAAGAAAAFALPNLRGRTSDAARARRAAVHAAELGVPIGRVSECLDLRPRAVKALQALPVEPHAVRAVRAQAVLLRIVQPRPTADLVPARRVA